MAEKAVMAFLMLLKLLATEPAKNPNPPEQRLAPPPSQCKMVKPEVPQFVLKPPKHCYAGISKPSATLQEARRSAVSNAAEQILTSIGANYNLTLKDSTQGEIHALKRTLTDTLSVNAEWFLKDLENSIAQSTHALEAGKHIYYVLIHYPPEKIERMRKLTRGPQLTTKTVMQDRDRVIFEISETAGVTATINKIRVIIIQTLRCADFLNYYVAKLPKTKGGAKTVQIPPFTLRNSSKTISIKLHQQPTILYTQEIIIEIEGQTETGKPIRIQITPNN